MGDSPRRRVDLMRLPLVLRYVIALAVVALVVFLVVAVTPGGQTSPGWYNNFVVVGAVALLVVGSGWVVLRIWRWLRR